MKAINPGHFLLTCRLDNWVHLLEENHFHIARDRLPQALYISATALALAPAAAAESLIYRKRIRETKIEKDPIFILGHWRSGTTYLQNVLSRDEQFGWFDPVNTIGLPYSLLLGRLIQPPIHLCRGIALIGLHHHEPTRRITCSTRSISRWRRRSAC